MFFNESVAKSKFISLFFVLFVFFGIFYRNGFELEKVLLILRYIEII